MFSGLGAYLLAFVLTRCHGASFVAAIAFAFAPYRLSHTQHLQLLSSYWMPVAIAALHLFVAAPRWRWAALFAASWLLQALACGYYLFFLSIFALLWLAWFAPGRLSIRQTVRLGDRVGDRGLRAGAGPARVPVDPRVRMGSAQSGRSRELQRRHRGLARRVAGLAAVERPALRAKGPSRRSFPA